MALINFLKPQTKKKKKKNTRKLTPVAKDHELQSRKWARGWIQEGKDRGDFRRTFAFRWGISWAGCRTGILGLRWGHPPCGLSWVASRSPCRVPTRSPSAASKLRTPSLGPRCSALELPPSTTNFLCDLSVRERESVSVKTEEWGSRLNFEFEFRLGFVRECYHEEYF